jgi:hypothetical protein
MERQPKSPTGKAANFSLFVKKSARAKPIGSRPPPSGHLPPPPPPACFPDRARPVHPVLFIGENARTDGCRGRKRYSSGKYSPRVKTGAHGLERGGNLLLSLTRNPAGRAGLCPPNQAAAIADPPFRTRTFPERIPSSFAVPVTPDFGVFVLTFACFCSHFFKISATKSPVTCWATGL